MRREHDRPQQPFLDGQGRPRNRTRLSPSGQVTHRSGQAIIDLKQFADGTAAPARVVETVGKVAGVTLRVDDADRKQGDRSGLLRVHFDPEVDVTEMVARVRNEFGDGKIFPNTVFTIGALTASPMHFGSVGADPMHFGSAYSADPMHFANSSTARPTQQPLELSALPRPAKGAGRATVAILDTGIPADGLAQPSDIDFPGPNGMMRDQPDMNSDDFLDIAAGHTTFIRTIIQRGSPVAEVMVEGVIHNDGDGDEADISNALQRVFDATADKTRLIVNLSFSGYYDEDAEPPLIAFWIRELVDAGAVVVAAAGNDGACRKKFPAAMAEVISVAALGPCGPAAFSNHGSWVDACAPGEDLVSEFFDHFDGAYEPLVEGSAPDIDDFHGWAMWSGTSFSTPAVVASIAELVEAHDCAAQAAAQMLLQRPGLYRIADYGVVVNRIF